PYYPCREAPGTAIPCDGSSQFGPRYPATLSRLFSVQNGTTTQCRNHAVIERSYSYHNGNGGLSVLPLYLSIEGLYSYQQKQEIDFTLLTEAGLFGIFGKVGSGKSSILEAIGFVLYGETERLNKQEKRTYNMLNLKSNAACIVFEFLNFNGTKYRFVAQWRRRKKFEETTSLERTAYEWQNEQWIPLSSTDGSAITNLTYSNFRRTIIIPQGQFKEFLEL